MAFVIKPLALALLFLAIPAVLGFGSSPEAPSVNRRSLLIGTSSAAAAVVATAAFPKPSLAFYSPPPESLNNKVVVITGGTSGLGLESAKRLAAAGSTVVITSRTEAKGSKAVEEIKAYGAGGAKVYSVLLDLDDLESAKSFPQRFKQSPAGNQKIDVLLNNAGVMAIPTKEVTKDGFERTFQSNHLGHFVLTAKLFGNLSEDAKIINVASEAYKFAGGGLEINNLNGEESYGPWSSYGQSKLSNILFTKELQARLDKAGLNIKTYTLHPGAVQTDLARNMMGVEKWDSIQDKGLQGFDYILFNTLAKFIKTVQDGASTQIFLAATADQQLQAGKYYVDEKATAVWDYANDMDAANKLWELSEKLGRVSFPI